VWESILPQMTQMTQITQMKRIKHGGTVGSPINPPFNHRPFALIRVIREICGKAFAFGL
jgi:hypothetical protein